MPGIKLEGLCRAVLRKGMRWRAAAMAAALAGALPMAGPAQAQDYPSHFIKMIVGYDPGAGTDLLARLSAADMSKSLGQPMPVENRAGANSALAARVVATGPADGYTLLFGASAMIANVYGMKEPGYKMSDFVTIGGYAYSPFVLFVNTRSSGARTLKDLVAYGKAHPGKLTYASLGVSSPANLASHRLDGLSGIGWTEVPFKSGNDALVAVIAGTVDAFFGGVAQASAIQGKADVAMFAISSKARGRSLPDVPTFAEQGFQVFDSFSDGIFAPAGTPKPVVDKLRAALDEAKKVPEARKKIEAVGLDVYEGSAAEYEAELADQARTIEADFKKLHIEPQ